jgi:hypothetical protein
MDWEIHNAKITNFELPNSHEEKGKVAKTTTTTTGESATATTTASIEK